MLNFLNISGGFGSDRNQSVSLLLFQSLCELLLEFGLVSRATRSVVFINLLVLGKLLFELGELGLELWFLKGLALLVGIDDPGCNELIGSLALVLFNQNNCLVGIGLKMEVRFGATKI
jgi:hypothetical protein